MDSLWRQTDDYLNQAATTAAKQNEMLAQVIHTGAHTRDHPVVALLARGTLEELSHFQQVFINIGGSLIFVTIGLVALFRYEDFLEILRFAMVLTVTAMLVVLPAVLASRRENRNPIETPLPRYFGQYHPELYLAGYIWLYALAWGLFNDAVKQGTFYLLRQKGLYV